MLELMSHVGSHVSQWCWDTQCGEVLGGAAGWCCTQGGYREQRTSGFLVNCHIDGKAVPFIGKLAMPLTRLPPQQAAQASSSRL